MHTAFRRASVLWALLVLVTAAAAGAQSTTGSIQGTVKDNQQAVVPGATVTIRNTRHNATRSATTDGSGTYRFLNMRRRQLRDRSSSSQASPSTCDPASPSR